MDEPSFENASLHEVNKLLRVLSGEKLKYTVRVNLPDGKVVEWQSNSSPSPKWYDEDRCMWLCNVGGDYTNKWICKWVEGSILLVEENPK